MQIDITELKYKLVNKLVEEGLIKDYTDTDEEEEVNAENCIEEVLKEYLKPFNKQLKKL